MTPDDMKREAARAALAHVESGMRLGLGHGSTAKHFVDLLGEKVRDGLDVICVPASEFTHDQAKGLGIPLTTLDETPELDLAVGWAHPLSSDWAVDVYALRYRYPGATTDLDWTELDATLTWRNDYWISAGWSNEALGYDRHGLYVQAGARFPLAERFRIETVLGHYFLSNAVFARSGYTHAQVNAVWTLRAPLELRVSAHATDAHAKAIFGDYNAGSRIEAALQASF